MAQLSLQSFINTHPSPAEPSQGGNINFWITTGSSGEFYVNGITIPLVNQESSLATVISQAESIEFKLPTVNLEGYTFSNDTTNATVAGVTGYTRVSFNNSTLSNVSRIFLNGDGLLNYSGSLSKWSELAVSSSSITFTSSTKKATFSVANVTYTPGMSDYFTIDVYNPEGTLFANNESVKIRLNAGPADISDDYTNTDFLYSKIIDAKEKIISGSSLYHYYLLFENPVNVRYYDISNKTIDTYPLIFSPTFTSTFKYSEYEVVGNDIQEPRKSNFLLKVDRNTSQANPTNLTSIISSSILGVENTDEELFGDVQDSYYESLSWTTSRYGGTQNISSEGLIPTAFVATPIEGYVFDNEISSSQLIESINNGTQLFPSISTVYFYNESQLSSISTGFTLQPSSSLEATSSTGSLDKLTVTRVDSLGAPTVSDLGGTVTVSFYVTDNWGGFSTIERDITISAGQSSGFIYYNALKITTSFTGWVEESTTVEERFSGIVRTTLSDTDYIGVGIKITPESRLVGLTKFLEDREDRKELIPLKGKKVYDSRTKALYEVDTNGLLISILQ